jgi:hypothetical protein
MWAEDEDIWFVISIMFCRRRLISLKLYYGTKFLALTLRDESFAAEESLCTAGDGSDGCSLQRSCVWQS